MQTTARFSRPLGAALLIAVLFVAAGQAPSTAAAETRSADKVVDLNAASPQELMTIPGIGETLARRIVEFREEHGPFKRVEDLMKVKGIGEKSFQKLKEHVKVSRSSK